MSFIRHRRATSPNKFECRNYDSKTQHFELIDYKPEFIRKDYSISPFKNMHPKVIIKSALRIPDKIKRNSKFQTFREENTVCSKQCLSEGDFKNICNSFDEIVVGSDQVWNYNLTEHDMHYFLPEIGASVKKVAYAASTGGADFSTQESNKMILYIFALIMRKIAIECVAQNISRVN